MTQSSIMALALAGSRGAFPDASALDPAALSGAEGELFASLLGQEFSQVSPEVLRLALAQRGGEALPLAGEGLPEEPAPVPADAALQAGIPPAIAAAAMVPVSEPAAQMPDGFERLGVGQHKGVAQGTLEVAARRPVVTTAAVSLELEPANPDSPEETAQAHLTALAPPTSSQGSSGPSHIPAAVPMRPTSIDVPVNRPGWDQSLGHRVSWMAQDGRESAEIQLNPPHLGPLKVRVELNGDQANVSFASNHVLVRDAVEAAVPRLREMLEASGLSLVNVDVSEQGSPQRHGADSNPAYGDRTGSEDPDDPAPQDAAVRAETAGVGLVDYYV